MKLKYVELQILEGHYNYVYKISQCGVVHSIIRLLWGLVMY